MWAITNYAGRIEIFCYLGICLPSAHGPEELYLSRCRDIFWYYFICQCPTTKNLRVVNTMDLLQSCFLVLKRSRSSITHGPQTRKSIGPPILKALFIDDA